MRIPGPTEIHAVLADVVAEEPSDSRTQAMGILHSALAARTAALSWRACDNCGRRMTPYFPRTRGQDGSKMLCPMCAKNQPRTASVMDSHPHELWQKQMFGCYHVSNGRRLPVHNAGLLSHPEQDDRMRDYDRWDVHKAFDPNQHMIAGAQAYNRLTGLGDPHHDTYEHIGTNRDNIIHVGRAYDALPEHDHSPEVQRSFEAMRHEVGNQYHHLTHTMGIDVQPVAHDPYANVGEMHHDLLHNKRLKVLNTETTGGHPFFTNDENDRFRAVHDAFGHAATGRSFDANGEEAAWMAHSRMFTRHALPALTSETRGQNASLHLNGDFGPQRIALLPRHMWLPSHELHQGARKTAADWNDYRWMQDAQNRRYERAGVGGGQAEHDEFYGKGEYRGAGTEHRITPQEWMRMSRQPRYEEMPPTEHEWQRGFDMGYGHGSDADHADLDAMDRAHTTSQHPDHFYDGYSEGFHSGVNTAHTAAKVAEMDQGELTAQFPQWQPLSTGRGKPHEEAQPAMPKASPRPRYPGAPGRWPYNQNLGENRSIVDFDPYDTERSGQQHAPFHTTSALIAVSSDGRMKHLAHDSGTSEVIYHCPFCGSGQVIARSDGTVMCEFCSSSFTVQVQPEFSAFPQTIDGMPVDIPGMPAGSNQDAGGGGVDEDGNPLPADDEGGNPFADDSDPADSEEDGPEEDGDDTEDEPIDSGGNPLFNKKSYRTASGAELSELDYIRHLALQVTSDRDSVLNRIRLERIADTR